VKTNLLVATFFLAYIASSACVGQVSNPGFEEAATAPSIQPKNWTALGAPGDIRLDDQQKFAGSWSLRIARSGEFAGAAQMLKAAPYVGRTVFLRANLKGKDVGEGAAGIWLRGDDSHGKPTFFATSYHLEIRGTTGWQSKEIRTVVPAETERLVFGPAMAADGTLWVDEFQIGVVDPSFGKKTSSLAQAYLDEAVGLIKKNAYYSDRVDWAKTTRTANTLASGSATTQETYSAITYVLSALGDHHSRLLSASTAKAAGSDATVAGFDIRSRSVHGHGYVLVPGFLGGGAQRGTAFAEHIQKAIKDLKAAGSCGWIVDLRSNGGGNMYPMISGLSPLLGDGTLGYFIGKGKRQSWYVKDGRSGISGDLAGPTRKSRVNDAEASPVAVLIGPGTASSGEATLVSFLGRPNTRTFGQSTSGQSTANVVLPLSDGAQIALTTALLADRAGREYGSPIPPDQFVAAPAHASTTSDNALEAASNWLDASLECGRK
jgi:carboxyl-terminal processing protease